MYDEDTAGDGKKTVYCNAAAWPGEGMTYDEGQDMWYYKVPTTSYLNGQPNDFDLTKSKNAYFIVSGSGNNQQFPASGGHSPKLNAQSWEYTGGTKFVASTRVPTPVVVPATEVTKGTVPQPTTAAPTTQKPTQAPTTAAPTTQKPTQKPTDPQPTKPVTPGTYLFGDVNFDGIVDIEDATLVQLHSAASEDSKLRLSGLALFLADVNLMWYLFPQQPNPPRSPPQRSRHRLLPPQNRPRLPPQQSLHRLPPHRSRRRLPLPLLRPPWLPPLFRPSLFR